MSEAKKTKKVGVTKKVITKKDGQKTVKKTVAKKEETKKSISTKTSVIKKDVKSGVTKTLAVDKKNETKREAKGSFIGKYIQSIGRRKTAVAQIRMYEKGNGDFVVNGISGSDYFKKEDNFNIVLQPLKVVSKIKDFDFSIIVKGGGILGQLDAIRHGIARALIKYDPEFKVILKVNGYMTRDPRKKERKKPGLKKARKAPQWSKR